MLSQVIKRGFGFFCSFQPKSKRRSAAFYLLINLKFIKKCFFVILAENKRLKRYDEAIGALTEAYSIDNRFIDALISRGNVYVDYGHNEAFNRAQRDYEHVLLREANNIDAHINLAYLHQISGKFMRAWNQFTAALESNKGLFAILF
jgi:tetratricopeptide (TPR) repeat protein